MITLSMGVEQLREIYFDGLTEDDNESFPTVTRTGLLVGELESTTLDLYNDLLGWTLEPQSWHQLLWHSEKHLAAFLHLWAERRADIYLFTFDDHSSYHAGVAHQGAGAAGGRSPLGRPVPRARTHGPLPAPWGGGGLYLRAEVMAWPRAIIVRSGGSRCRPTRSFSRSSMKRISPGTRSRCSPTSWKWTPPMW